MALKETIFFKVIFIERDKKMKLSIAQLTKKMIEYSKGNIHDIEHFLLVWSYAKTIGELEGIDKETQYIIETAALTHDIACPLCREKYGEASGGLQELEGPALVKAFLADSGLTETQIERVAFLVGHHHTLKQVESVDYQILIEADYIANASENGFGRENIESFMRKFMKTKAGIRLAENVLNE